MPNALPTPVPPVMPASPVMSSQPQYTPPPTPSPKRKGPLVATLIALIVILGGAGAASAYYFFVYQQTPEKVLERSAVVMSKLQSVSFDGAVTVNGTAAKPNDINDETAPGAQSVTGIIRAKGATTLTDSPTADVTLTASSTTDTGASVLPPFTLQTRIVNGVTYFNISKFTLPNPLTFEDVLAPYGDVVFDKWIEFDKDRLVAALGLTGVIKKAEDAQADKNSELQKTYGGRIDKAILATFPKFIHVTKTIGTETVDGAQTTHYEYTADKQALTDLSSELTSILPTELAASASGQINALSQGLDNLQNPHGEIWVSKADAYIRKVTFDGDAVDQKTGTTYHFSFTLALSEFNQPVVVEKPATSTPIETIITTIMVNSSEERTKQLSDDDNDGLTFAQETQYGTDPNKADTDGDGFVDGEEVKKGFNPNGPGTLPKPMVIPLTTK